MSPYQVLNAQYQHERTALLERQETEVQDLIQRVRGQGLHPNYLKSLAGDLGKRHLLEQKELQAQWQAKIDQLAASAPSSNNFLLGSGMMLSGAAAGGGAYGYQPLAPIPSIQHNNATILQPGQPPAYYYGGNPGTLLQPGHSPTYIYSFP